MEYLERFYSFCTGGVPSHYQNYHDIKWGVLYCYENCTYGDFSPATFYENLHKYTVFDTQQDLSIIGGLAILWTVIRYILAILLFKPTAQYFQLVKANVTKFPESAWKLLMYCFTWSYTCYVIFGLPQYNHIFYQPDTLWDDYDTGMHIEPIVYYLYMIQLSFYVHSIYATFFMDAWRKDSLLMVFHHFLTISLIGFSYAARYHKIGLLVLFMHDVTDIALEFTKCNVYFKNRGGHFYKFHDALSTVGFVVFTICWYLFRLYWLPLKVLHSTGYATMKYHERTALLPFYFFFNVMLWILQAMNIYWFLFIVNFLIKVATGQIDEVDDIREKEVKEKMSKKKTSDNSGARRLSPRNRSKKAN